MASKSKITIRQSLAGCEYCKMMMRMSYITRHTKKVHTGLPPNYVPLLSNGKIDTKVLLKPQKKTSNNINEQWNGKHKD